MNAYKKIIFLLPIFIFLFIAITLFRGLHINPTEIPSPFINKKSPEFSLPTLFDSRIMTSSNDFLGHVTLVNVFATWCASCIAEHKFLLNQVMQEHIEIYGFNYKDDTVAVKKWLKKQGNPYKIIAVDETGNTAIDWGVYGTPETFIIDKKGFIRYKKIGPLNIEVWNTFVKPLILQLQHETI